MRNWVQRKNLLPFVLCGLIIAALVLGAFSQTILVPLIDQPGRTSYCRGVEEAFAAAKRSIDILLSDAQLEGNPLWEKLLAAAGRGVSVRVLLDASAWKQEITEKNSPTIAFLRAHGIAAKLDDPAVTTHAKLVVIDRSVVILGSSNWNRHALNEQVQTNLRIADTRVGEVFATYFDRLWQGTLFPGAVKLDLSSLFAPGPLIIPVPETVESENYAHLAIKLLNSAQRSVHVVMYRISHYPRYKRSLTNEILAAMITAAARGLDVRVLMDDCAFYPDSAAANQEAASYLRQHGVEVRMDDPDKTTHAKLVIIDGESVLLGSTNWNYYSLEKDNEVDLALLRIPTFAEFYESLFRTVWRAGRTPGN